MVNVFPGATWRPMPGQEKRPKRRKGRGVGLHIAVFEGPSIWQINLGTGNDAHLYVRRDGSVEQDIDLDLQAYAGADGNGTMIWVETQGGTTAADVKSGRWTPQQAETLAQIAAWAHRTEGVPLQVMADSRPASRGIGTHRLGVQHSRGVGAVPGWLVAGGERWTKHIGKECPGDARIGQVPSIVDRARQIVNGSPPPQEDDMPSPEDLWNFPINGVKARDRLFGLDSIQLPNLAGQVAGLQAAITAIAQNPGTPVDLDAVFKAAQDGARSIVDNLRVVAESEA